MDQVLLVVLCNLGRPSMQHPWPAQVKQEPRRTSPQSREHHLHTEPDPDAFLESCSCRATEKKRTS